MITRGDILEFMRGHSLAGGILAGAGIVAVYASFSLLLLRRWGETNPWLRVDVFAGTGLLFNGLLAAQQLRLYRQLPASLETRNEAFGYTFDPAMAQWISIRWSTLSCSGRV